MDVKTLQRELARLGLYGGALDGLFGQKSRAALGMALTGPTARVTEAQIADVAEAMGLSAAVVGAVYDVESRGRGMDEALKRPIILFEPHVFSRLTSHRYDASHSTISYRRWGTLKYPAAQAARWDQLFAACALDPGAALQSASWGLFQIMGFNHAAAGYETAWSFALGMAKGEGFQLRAFARFVGSQGLIPLLTAHDWAGFARRYNGPAYADNAYDRKLAAAYARRSGR